MMKLVSLELMALALSNVLAFQSSASFISSRATRPTALTRLATHSRAPAIMARLEEKLIGNRWVTHDEWLDQAEDPRLATLCRAMFAACKDLAYKVRTASCDKYSCWNEYGDEQLAVNILASNSMLDRLRESGACSCVSSEEEPIQMDMGGEGFAVALDPLDGSSILETNFAVGSIFGCWPGDSLIGVTGRQMAAAGAACYGPRTTMTLALSGVEGTHQFLLVDDFSERHGQWMKTNSFYTINEGKLYAPGNIRATKDNKGYADLVAYWQEEGYQLRYTGGLVADVSQLIVKGKGIFAHPASVSSKPKLRLLYEVAPLAYLVEKAGGESSDGEQSILDKTIITHDQRAQAAFGSKLEVERFNEMVGRREQPVKDACEDPCVEA